MENKLKSSATWVRTAELVAPLGLSVVQSSYSIQAKGTRMGVFLIKVGDEVTSDELERAFNVIYPYFNKTLQDPLSLEVSSPGIDRQIKDAGEFEFYCGKEVALYLASLSAWVNTRVDAFDENSGTLTLAGQTINCDTGNPVEINEVNISDIKKAKLNHKEVSK